MVKIKQGGIINLLILERGLDFQQESFDLLQGLNQLETFLGFFISFQKIFRALDSQLSATQEIMYQLQVFNINRPEVTVTFPVFAGLKNIEFTFW